MSNRNTEVSPRRAALIAGVGYLVIFVLAIFANFGVVNGLIESGDAAATAANIQGSEGLFRAGTAAFAVVFVVDVIVAWALFVLFRKVHRDLSLITAWLRLAYTVLLGVAVVFLVSALRYVGGADALAVLDPVQANAHALVALEAFDTAWLVGLLAFGAHLAVLGHLVVRSGAAPRVLGYVLMVAGAAYAADTLAHVLMSNYADVESVFLAIVAVPSIVGELWLTIWLLVKGGTQPAALPAV
jgi:hypothetical protein